MFAQVWGLTGPVSSSAVVVPALCMLAGAVLAIATGPRPTQPGLLSVRLSSQLSYGAAAIGCIAALATGLMQLLGNGTGATSVTLFDIIPGMTASIRLTNLGAFFWIVFGLAGCAVSIYAIGYSRHYAARPSVGLLGAVFNVFLLSLFLVTLADNALVFLIAWETMALLSFGLVVYDDRQAGVLRAGIIYLIMTHIGTAGILLCFLVLASHAGGVSFAAFQLVGSHLDTGQQSLVFLLALAGFGMKAGIMPLHMWLPRAHPVAPSHVSALMSGIMIKTGVYGLILVAFTFLGPGPLWWGLLVMGLGALSAVVGILSAMMHYDLKRLLAYSSVENMGIIFIALGAALMLRSAGLHALAALAIAAALVHVLNHALFKTLLFLVAGAIQQATHTRNMEQLGGLIRRMPQTALVFMLGSLAIIGLPPLNGFSGEWLTFQALLAVGRHMPAAGYGGGALLVAAALGLTGGLAAACFVKATGISLLAQPRSDHAAHAREVGPTMRLGMGFLAGLCVALGFVPGIAFLLANHVIIQVLSIPLPGAGSLSWESVTALAFPDAHGASPNAGVWRPWGVLLGLLGVALLIGVLLRIVRRADRTVPSRTALVWACGVVLRPEMQYTSTSFAQPLRRMFRFITMPSAIRTVRFSQEPYFVGSVRYTVGFKPIYNRYLYVPVRRGFLAVVALVRTVQNGSIHAYLAYLFVALLAVLAVSR